jgi:hypothetical protein
LGALLVVEALCAVFGYIGGIMFFVDPSGRLYGLDVQLPKLPVGDFLLVGVWLFVVYGLGFSLVTHALRSRRPWGWIGAVGLSAVWIVWIGVENYLLGVSVFINVWLIPPVMGLILLAWPGMRGRLTLARRGAAST